MHNKSTRILLLTTAFRPFIGGSEIAIEEIAKRLRDIKFDVITPLYTNKLAKTEERDNVRIFRVGRGRLGDKFFLPLFGFLLARRLLKENEYQFVHAYQASYAAGLGWLLKILNPKLKFLLTLQEGKDLDAQNRIIKFFRGLIVKKADFITVISMYLKDYARRLNKKARISLISNGVDAYNFNKEYNYGELSELADRLVIKPGEKVIITISRLVPKNGVDILIRATEILNYKLKYMSFKLLIVGDGEQRNELVSLANRIGVSDKVIWAGSVSHADLPKYLKISDIFVRSSRSEGLGSAFLEAMAAGVPIIGTEVGGIPDFLKNKETGLFAEINNPEDLADKISLILNDKNLSEKLIKNARELVIKKYDWDKIADQFRELYEDLF